MRAVMSKVLIIYGTTDGHTQKIATRLGEMFRAEDVGADVFHAADVPADVDPYHYDGVIVAASVHVGGFQKCVHRWVLRHRTALNDLPSAFFSVCLGVLEPEPEVQREVRAIIQRFLDRVGWVPAFARAIPGALPWSKYGWLKTFVMKRIVAKKMGSVDPTRDVEYTDWADLRAFSVLFAERFRPVPATVPAG